MKKVIFLVMFLIVSATSFSQQTNLSNPVMQAARVSVNETGNNRKLQLGIKTGVAFSCYKIDYTDPAVKAGTRTKMSYIIGVLLSCPLGQNISFRPGFELVRKGAVETVNTGNNNYSANYGYASLDIPFNILYEPKSKTGKLFLRAALLKLMYFSGTIEFYTSSNLEKITNGEFYTKRR